ncbi:BspA family leucine-rich repeat surface protein [Companilactobacillus muriivasis]|uniref:BspA family leucine-rich repeat surface protein n=1 Tax=Companilactobacillus muriivasis TaxID=3081444 RepID=UPI0030C7462E
MRKIKSMNSPNYRIKCLESLIISFLLGTFFIFFNYDLVNADTANNVQAVAEENFIATDNQKETSKFNTIMPLSISSESITHSGVDGTANWDIDTNGKLTVHAGRLAYGIGNWAPYASLITSVYVEPGVITYGSILTTDKDNGVFAKLTNVTTIDVTNLDVSESMTLGDMFYRDSNLTNIIGLDTWDTSKCESMNDMFSNDYALTNLDVSKFDTSSVTGMNYMFLSCKSLESLDVSSFNTSRVLAMNSLFSGVSGKIIGLDKMDVGKVTNFSSVFDGVDFTKTNADDIKDWDISKATSLSGIFANTKFTSLDLSKWNMQNVTDMSGMFSGSSGDISQVKDISNWDLSKVTTTAAMFSGVKVDDLSVVNNWNVSNVENMGEMFSDCTNLKSLDLSKWKTDSLSSTASMFKGSKLLNEDTLKGYQTLVTAKNTNISNMFNGTSFQTIDLSKYDTSNVTSFAGLFRDTTKLQTINENFDTSSVTNMSYIFSGSSFNGDDSNIADWDTSRVTDLSAAFYASSGTNYDYIKNWDTSSVQNLYETFSAMKNAKSLPISNWDVSKVKNFNSTFNRSLDLVDVPVRDWNVSSGTDMRGMFVNDTSIKNLDLSKWNTQNVTRFDTMFDLMTNLETLDISGFDTTNATDLHSLFGSDENLWKLTLGPKSVLINLKGSATPLGVGLITPVPGTIINDDTTDKTYSAISDKWQAVDTNGGGTDHEPLGDLFSAQDIVDKFSTVGNPVTTYVWQQQTKGDMKMTVPDIDFGTTSNASGLVRRKSNFAIDVTNNNYPTDAVPSDLSVSMDAPLTDETDNTKTLNDVLVFKDKSNNESILSSEDTKIYSGDIANGSNTISWDNDHGILLNMNNDRYASNGHYSTTLKWTLTNSL